MTAPAAEPTPEHERGQQRQHEEDQSGVDHAVLAELHAFAGLDRSDRLSTEPSVFTAEDPQHDVNDDEQLDDGQHDGPTPAHSTR